MGVPSDTSSASTLTRLKREDFRRTKHDSAFSQWKILIGASDWEDHSMGKGAEKYRTQNLPNWTSCHGVYELGIAASRPKSGRETRKLNSSSVVPVYLGQADNLRTRLQQYGRDGSHLETGCSNIKIADGLSESSCKGQGLFTNIFPRGLPIVYRCAPMKSKKDAEITEKQLLDKFDYAWNKGSNGVRREHDIYKILDHREKASQFSLLAKKILFSNPREVGIKIKTSSNSSNTDNNTIFSRILGTRRVQARQEQYGRGDNCNDICGVSMGHGSVCTAAPVAGRKRCALHKGLQVNGYISKLNREGIATHAGADMGFDFENPKLRGVAPDEKFRPSCGDNCNDICGASIGHGSACTTAPVAGRKRCAMHKGLRVNGYISKLDREGIAAPIGASMGFDFEDQKSRRVAPTEKFIPSCGFILEDGCPCATKPVRGNKRCLEHKGRRIR